MQKITTITLALVSSTILATAGESHHYLSLTAGTLDIDKVVYGDLDGNNDYRGYDSIGVTGLDYSFMKEIGQSKFMIGVRPAIQFNEGDFFEGGLFNINLLAGQSFGKFKLYANAGFGLQSLSEYTASIGLNYGLTARYDIFEHFSAAVSYNRYNMKISDEESTKLNYDYKMDGILASLSFKF